MRQEMFTIISQEEIANKVYRLRLQGNTANITTPGQFVNLKLNGLFLRRPISVCDVKTDVLTVVYKVVGQGTDILHSMKAGETIDILTGLGNGYGLQKAGNQPLLIGGGVGVPPLLWLAKQLRAVGKEVQVVLGFNTQKEVMLEEEFRRIGCNVEVRTMDGSYGKAGLVTDAMDITYSYYYACGPLPMLRAVIRQAATQGEVSMETRMGCGFGICVGCTMKTTNGYKRVCKDGPVFESGELIFENE